MEDLRRRAGLGAGRVSILKLSPMATCCFTRRAIAPLPPPAACRRGDIYFDVIIRQQPFKEEDLRVEDNLEEFERSLRSGD